MVLFACITSLYVSLFSFCSTQRCISSSSFFLSGFRKRSISGSASASFMLDPVSPAVRFSGQLVVVRCCFIVSLLSVVGAIVVVVVVVVVVLVVLGVVFSEGKKSLFATRAEVFGGRGGRVGGFFCFQPQLAS